MKAQGEPNDLLFTSDEHGKVTHVRGIPLPDRLIHVVTDTSVTDRAPRKDTGWVLRGAYKFIQRVRGDAP